MVYHASFQDILFVLAGIAWVAYSAYRSNKKREAAKKAVPEKKYSVFDALLDEVMPSTERDESRENSEIPTQVATPFNDNASMIHSDTNITADNRYVEFNDEGRDTEMESFEEEEVRKEAKRAYDQKKQKVNKIEFDLKKAFIYSEILNRKYI